MFKQGDVIYTCHYCSNTSYTYLFGKVVKITKTDKIRVQPIQTKYGERKEELTNDGALFCIRQAVEPDEDADAIGKSFLVNVKGWYAKHKLQFFKYDPNKKLENYLDGLD